MLSLSPSNELLESTKVTSSSSDCTTAEAAVVSFDLGKATIPSSAVLLFTPTSGTPSTVSLTTVRAESSFSRYILPLGSGGVLAAFLVAGILLMKKPERKVILASSSWSFTDSWATNITAAGALLSTVLTASEALTSYLPAVSLDWFTLLSVAWGGLVVVAPLINGALAEDSNNQNAVQTTLLRVSIAAVVTLFGVGGELGTIAALVSLSPGARSGEDVFLYAGLVAVAASVVVYGVRSILTQLNPENDSTVQSSLLSKGSLTSLTL